MARAGRCILRLCAPMEELPACVLVCNTRAFSSLMSSTNAGLPLPLLAVLKIGVPSTFISCNSFAVSCSKLK
jgi:hypothetical protein